MKNMKKAIALMMALILALGCIPLTASADEYYYPACSCHSESIVDALKSVGVENTSYQHREVIALYNGLQDYEGTADQNQVLLRALKDGVLKNPDYSGTSDTWGPDSIYSCRQYAECTAGGECYTVKDNNAPLRTGASKHDAVIDNVQQGTLLKVIDVVKNNFGNKWAKIEYVDTDNTVKYGFIFEPHIERHVDHSYVTLLDTLYGDLDVCLVCGHATAHVVVEDEGSDFFEFDLLDIANQAVKGDYYDNSSFWGILGRVLAGDIPYFGWVFDARDFVYDATNCDGVVNCATYLTLDAAALLPVVGGLKIIARSDDLKKGIQTLPLNELPSEVQTAFKKYDQVNWAGTYKGSAPGTHAGGYFNNANKDGSIPLPSLDANGNSISYHEFDVNNKIVGNYRDKARFVRGSDGRTYITFDHYDTFVRIVDWSE